MAPKVNKFAIQQDFPVSVEVFRKLFWEEDGTFERMFHETIRMDSEVVMSGWQNDVRTKSYKPNVKILGGMKVNVVSKESQTRSFSDNKLTIIQEVTTLSVGTTSVANSIWVVSNIDKGCRVDASTEVKMSGPFFIVTDELCRSATSQVKESVQKWLDAAAKHIAKVEAEKPAAPVPSSHTTEPAKPTAVQEIAPPSPALERPLVRAGVSVYETETDETAPCRPTTIIADTSSVAVERDPAAPRDPDIPPLDEDSVVALDQIDAQPIHPVRRVSTTLRAPSPSPLIPYETSSLSFSTATTPMTAPSAPVSPTTEQSEQAEPKHRPRTEKHLLLLLTFGLGMLLVLPLLIGNTRSVSVGSVEADIATVTERVTTLEAEIQGLHTRLNALTSSLKTARDAASSVGAAVTPSYGVFGWLLLVIYYTSIAVAVYFVLRYEVPMLG